MHIVPQMTETLIKYFYRYWLTIHVPYNMHPCLSTTWLIHITEAAYSVIPINITDILIILTYEVALVFHILFILSYHMG